mgnify:CR=1 FL=1
MGAYPQHTDYAHLADECYASQNWLTVHRLTPGCAITLVPIPQKPNAPFMNFMRHQPERLTRAHGIKDGRSL